MFDLKNLKNKNKIIRALIIFSAIILFINIFLPFARKWNTQSKLIKEKKLHLEKSRANIAQEEELKLKFAAISQGIQAKLPAQRGQSNFLTAIGNVAQDTNLHIVTMNPRPFRDLGFFRELSVEINMESNLGNLVRFLYQMRKSSVVLTANRLQLEPKSDRSALLKGHLVISTIFLKDQI
ncbi:MAG: type 4a pilus biogenesis protein PilO [Candidatus Omnitrophota bacterium]